jgi:hypothetical protein
VGDIVIEEYPHPPVDLTDEIGVNVVLLDEILDRVAVIQVLRQVRNGNPGPPKDRFAATLPEGNLNGIVVGAVGHGGRILVGRMKACMDKALSTLLSPPTTTGGICFGEYTCSHSNWTILNREDF